MALPAARQTASRGSGKSLDEPSKHHLTTCIPSDTILTMENRKRILREYIDENGHNRFREWLDGLHDMRTQYVIDSRLTRITNGNMGDCEPVGEGAMEFRIHFGPGYRIYFGQEGKNLVILLVGGDKKSQRKDIVLAKTLWREFQNR